MHYVVYFKTNHNPVQIQNSFCVLLCKVLSHSWEVFSFLFFFFWGLAIFIELALQKVMPLLFADMMSPEYKSSVAHYAVFLYAF